MLVYNINYYVIYVLYSNYFICDTKQILQYPTSGQHHLFNIRIDVAKIPILLASHACTGLNTE